MDTITISCIDTTFIIRIPKHFRGVVWNNNFGDVQRAIRDKSYNSFSFNKIAVDFSSCIWADPLPMLSLCIALTEFVASSGNVSIYLPTLCTYENSNTAFLSFIVQEGFFDIFTSERVKADIVIGQEKFSGTASELEYLKDTNLLNFSNCHVLPAKILVFENYEINSDDYDSIVDNKVEAIVKELNDELLEALREKTPSGLLRQMCMKINHILFETINNTVRYSGINPVCSGIYVRYRSGLSGGQLNRLNKEKKDKLQYIAGEEEKHNPRLAAEMVFNSEGFFEVIIVDSGLGIQKTFMTAAPTENRDFMQCFQDVFFNKVRNTAKTKHITPYGGIDLISQILRGEKDYVFVHEGFDWIGINTSSYPVDVNAYHTKLETKKAVSGLSWIFRLSWKNNDVRLDTNENGIMYNPCKAIEHPIYRAFFKEYNNEIRNYSEYINRTFYLDERDPSWSGDAFLTAQGRIFSHFYWLPNEINSKNDIITSIERYTRRYIISKCINIKSVGDLFFQRIKDHYYEYWFVEQFTSCNTLEDCLSLIVNPKAHVGLLNYSEHYLVDLYHSNVKKTIWNKGQKHTLIILDIPSYEMVIYRNSLEDTVISKSPKLKGFSKVFDKLIICSRHYEVLAFSIESDKMIIDDILAESFTLNDFTIYQTDMPENIVLSSLWLRYLDSVRFWETLFKDVDKNSLYTNARIRWKDSCQPITGYLHFDNILQHPKLFEFIRLSVERLIGLFSNKRALFVNNDVLVRTIVDECNINLNVDESIENSGEIYIDSIFVTGLTYDSAYAINRSKDSIRLNIFCHPDSQYLLNASGSENQGILLLWMKNDWISKHIDFSDLYYERIGHTPFIKQINETIVNSTSIIYREETNDVYFRSLSDTYNDVQQRGYKPVLMGHFSYDRHHDFFKFDYQSIIENSKISLSRRGVFGFLLKTVFFLLLESENKRYINKMINKVSPNWRSIIAEAFKNGEDNWGRVSIIIYSSHHYTSLIVRDIKNCLPPEFSERFVPISTSVSKRKNSIIIPPGSIDFIKHKLTKFSNDTNLSNHILFFDTIIESGRTRKVLKHILLSSLLENDWKNKSNSNMKTLSVIDAYKLPYAAPEKDRHRSYWRFDIPRLGSNQACLLCNSINIAKEMINELRKKEPELLSDNGIISSSFVAIRINNWINSWQCISALRHSITHGIEEAVINDFNTNGIYSGFNPVIKTNIGLALYSAELQCIQLEDNIIENIITELGENHEQITLIISSKLLLSGEFTSQSFHIKMLEQMISSLSEIDANNYSSLAVLTLLLQDDSLIERALIAFIESHLTLDWQHINKDLLILLSYISQKRESIYLRLPYRITYLFDNKERKEAYSGFHFELYNVNGVIHKNALETICGNGFDLSNNNSAYILHKAYCSLQNVIKYLSYINDDEFLTKPDEMQVSIIRKSLYEKISDICRNIELLEMSASCDNALLTKMIKSTRMALLDLHARLFVPYGKSDQSSSYTLIKYIKTVIDENSQIFEIEESITNEKGIIRANGFPTLPDTPLNEIWYYWNADIKREFEFLLSNVSHSCEITLQTVFGEKAHMLVAVTPGTDIFTISLTNLSRQDKNYVISEMRKKSKTRPALVRNKKLGVDLIVESEPYSEKNEIYKLTMKMLIPVVRL